jgi:hypothetical protein
MVMIVQTLKRDIEQYAARLERAHPLMQKARSGTLPAAALAAYISNLLFSIRHNYPHLDLARRRAAELGQGAVAAYYAQKFAEEYGHDQWAEQDLDRLSADFDVPRSAPSESLAELMDYLNGVIERDPRCYLAHTLFIEYLTVLAGPGFLNAVEAGCGIPRSHLSVIARHVELDQHHVAEALAEMETLTSGVDETALLETLHQSMRCFESFCDEISRIAA